MLDRGSSLLDEQVDLPRKARPTALCEVAPRKIVQGREVLGEFVEQVVRVGRDEVVDVDWLAVQDLPTAVVVVDDQAQRLGAVEYTWRRSTRAHGADIRAVQ